MTNCARMSVLVAALGLTACGGAGTSSGGSTTGTAAKVAAPSIVSQPASRVVPSGQPATFAVVAAGAGLTYAWQRDGVAIPGATSPIYTTPPVSAADDGARFAVVVTNAAGAVASADARLRIEGFAATGAMGSPRENHTATALPDGRVLVAGGFATYVLSSAELYDPATRTFGPAGGLIAARQNHTATLLRSGKVLLAGGEGGVGGGVPLATAELYDPATGQCAPAGVMTTARTLHTATLLQDGRVLLAGGLSAHQAAAELATAELYDPATNRFTAVASAMGDARYWHAAALLPDGKVLVAGGYGLGGGALASADVFDPATGTFRATGSMAAPRYAHTATALSTGQVLVAGGYGATFLASAERYDPATGTFAPAGALAGSRYFHTATALPGGKVLLAGGLGAAGILAGAELYDPASDTFTATGPLSTGRYLDAAAPLLTGEVLVAGGWSLSDTGLASSELYSGAP